MVFGILCYSLQVTRNIFLHVFLLLSDLEPFSPFRKLYISMSNQLCIDLAITLREVLFSAFLVSSLL